MKHKLILLLIVLTCPALMGQIKFDAGSLILDTALSYSEKDTTATLITRDFNSVNILLNDRSGNDSVNAKVYFDQSTSSSLLDWVCIDSLTVTADSVWTPWNITEFPIMPWPLSRLSIDMLTDTVIDTTATVKISKGNAYNRR